MPTKEAVRSKGEVTTQVIEQDVFAPRVSVSYGCSQEHEFSLTFALEATTPSHWDCPRCGQLATRLDGEVTAAPQPKPARSHWDRLLQRRTIPELEALLAERLRELRNEM